MTLVASLVDYGSSDEDGPAAPAAAAAAVQPPKHTPLSMPSSAPPTMTLALVNTAPAVVPKADSADMRRINPKSKEIFYNPTVEELYAPQVGPENPFVMQSERAVKNMFTGFVEEAQVSEFHFEDNRRTFETRGYAYDPSTDVGTRIIGDKERALQNKGDTLATARRGKDDRKRKAFGEASDVAGFLGPWAGYDGESRSSAPSEEQKALLATWKPADSKKRGRGAAAAAGGAEGGEAGEAAVPEMEYKEESSTLHIDQLEDYLGRTYITPPTDTGVKFGEVPDRCFLPKKNIYTWSGHTKGVAAIRFFPVSAHLLLSAGMDSKVKIWEVYGPRRLLRTFNGHTQGVRDISFDLDGTHFVSASYDRSMRLWDTETGKCLQRFSNRKIPYCVKFHPSEAMKHVFICGTQDKKIIAWDSRSGEVVQEYDRHLGAVNTVSFIDEGRRIVSTSDDKSIRLWEWNVPVDTKHIAEPDMHAMPSAAVHPTKKWICFQSLDNTIQTYAAHDRFRANKKKTFKGHLVSAHPCQINFSPCGTYLISGDAEGYLCVWDWKTTKMYSKLKAHDGVCIGAEWNPNEPSKVATCGWDGLIKYWD
eukprot:m.236855 g.236855  ORF g.236855 m.236855 type:complete len:590 (-) comp20798_c0_seq1:25-1794(-)